MQLSLARFHNSPTEAGLDLKCKKKGGQAFQVVPSRPKCVLRSVRCSLLRIVCTDGICHLSVQLPGQSRLAEQ